MKPVFIIAIIFAIYGCSQKKNSLAGKYSTSPDGETEMIIEKNDTIYSCTLYLDENKKEFTELKEISAENMKKIFGENYSNSVNRGLHYGMFFFLDVKKGGKIDNKTFESEYYFILGPVTGNMYKIK